MVLKTETTHAGEFIVSEANGYRSREAVIIAAEQTIAAGQVLGRAGGVANRVASSAKFANNAANTGNLTLASPAFSSAAKPGVYRVTCITAAANGGIFRVEDPSGVEVGTATVGVAYDGEIKFTIADGATDFSVGEGFAVTVADQHARATGSNVTGTGNGTLTVANPGTASGVKQGVYTIVCKTAAANGGVFSVTDPQGIALADATVGVAYDGVIKFTIADGSTDFAAGDRFTVTVNIVDDDARYGALDLSATDGKAIAAAIAWSEVKTAANQTADIAAIVRDAEVRASDLVWPANITDAQKSAALAQLAERGIIAR